MGLDFLTARNKGWGFLLVVGFLNLLFIYHFAVFVHKDCKESRRKYKKIMSENYN